MFPLLSSYGFMLKRSWSCRPVAATIVCLSASSLTPRASKEECFMTFPPEENYGTAHAVLVAVVVGSMVFLRIVSTSIKMRFQYRCISSPAMTLRSSLHAQVNSRSTSTWKCLSILLPYTTLTKAGWNNFHIWKSRLLYVARILQYWLSPI